MGILSRSSQNSISRGYDYFKEKKVISFQKINDEEYVGKVQGNGAIYDVKINDKHTNKCSCNCPHADGTRKICKHMVALFFTSNPEEARNYLRSIRNEYRFNQLRIRERENEEKNKEKRIKEYIDSLSIKELKEKLFSYMCNDGYDLYEEEDDEYYNDYGYFYFDEEDKAFMNEGISLKLSTVVEGFDRISDFSTIYVNKTNNEIIELMDDYTMNEDYYLEIEENFDNYLALPSLHELDEAQVIRDFIFELNNDKQKLELSKAFTGKGAFRKFKTVLRELNLSNKFFEFKKEEYIKKAIKFLYYNNIDYIDDIYNN